MALRFKEITMTQQFELEEILALAVKAEPKYSVVFPYFNDNDFYNRDNQTIQLDHFDIKQAQEIMCDGTVSLFDTRTVELNGVTFTVTTKFNKPVSACMNLTYKAVKIENFERENRHCDETSNSTSISCDPTAVVLLDGREIKFDQEVEHYEVSRFQHSTDKSDRDASILINKLCQKWLNNRTNYQTLQRLFNTSLDRELYNR